jgi:hypothetical protein
MALTDTEIANIVFNETRSLSGPGISDARVNVAHAILNAEVSPAGLARMASTHATVPAVESAAYDDCTRAVKMARTNRAKNVDPTAGATHFNFRSNASRGAFYGKAIKTSVGPLSNSFPTDDLPQAGIYANTYE